MYGNFFRVRRTAEDISASMMFRFITRHMAKGSRVLVLHGGLGRLEDMQHQIRALAKTRFVIAADSRGHGRSTDTNDPLSYSRMANDMIKLLDALGISRTDVVGWSDGGIIGLELGMNSPERIRRLVAIGSNYDVEGLLDKPDPDAIPWRCRWLSWCETKQNRLARRKVNTMWLTQPHYTPADLAKITAPTLIIVGEHDAIKRSHTDQLARSIPGAVEEVISNASHFVINEQPNKVNARILSFLDQSLPVNSYKFQLRRKTNLALSSCFRSIIILSSTTNFSAEVSRAARLTPAAR